MELTDWEKAVARLALVKYRAEVKAEMLVFKADGSFIQGMDRVYGELFEHIDSALAKLDPRG